MVNFKNVETGNVKTALSEGWYTVKVVKADLKDSKNGPKTLINTEFNIVSPAKFDKRKVWTNFNLGPKSLWALKTFLEKAKSPLLDKGDVNEDTIAAGMPGLVVMAFLEGDVSPNGDPRNKITNWKEVEAEDPSSVTAETPSEKPKSNLFT
jgi:hypothetical protein